MAGRVHNAVDDGAGARLHLARRHPADRRRLGSCRRAHRRPRRPRPARISLRRYSRHLCSLDRHTGIYLVFFTRPRLRGIMPFV